MPLVVEEVAFRVVPVGALVLRETPAFESDRPFGDRLSFEVPPRPGQRVVGADGRRAPTRCGLERDTCISPLHEITLVLDDDQIIGASIRVTHDARGGISPVGVKVCVVAIRGINPDRRAVAELPIYAGGILPHTW